MVTASFATFLLALDTGAFVHYRIRESSAPSAALAPVLSCSEIAGGAASDHRGGFVILYGRVETLSRVGRDRVFHLSDGENHVPVVIDALTWNALPRRHAQFTERTIIVFGRLSDHASRPDVRALSGTPILLVPADEHDPRQFARNYYPGAERPTRERVQGDLIPAHA